MFCSRPVQKPFWKPWRWRAYSHEAYQQYSPSSLRGGTPVEREPARLRALRVVALAAGTA